MAKLKNRDENGYCTIHPKENAIPRCAACKREYSRNYYAKALKFNKRKKKNEETTIYYRKIKELGFDTNSIIVKAMHGNVTGHGKVVEQQLPRNIKIRS